MADDGLLSASTRFSIASDIDLHIAVAGTPRLALMDGVGEVDRSLVTTVVSELGRNILKYARRGQLRISRLEHGGAIDIEVVAQDGGPGIADLDAAMRDHFSSGGTLGLGLPGVRRMASEFRIRSAPGQGTCVTVRKRVGRPDDAAPLPRDDALPHPAPGAPASTADLRIEAARRVRPCIGEMRCGDEAVVVETVPCGLLLAIIDAAGHGADAAALAGALRTTLLAHAGAPLAALMRALHDVAQGSRGAAVGLAVIDRRARRLHYAGVGNTVALRLGGAPWRGVSREGVLGHRLPTLAEQVLPLAPGDVVLLHSDGLADLARRTLAPRLLLDGAAAIAQRLLQQFGRPHDDAGCVVAKCR